MVTITLNLSDAAAAEMTDAMCDAFCYPPTIWVGNAPQPNPETRPQFAKRMLVEYLRGRVIEYRRRQAAAAAAGTPPDITA